MPLIPNYLRKTSFSIQIPSKTTLRECLSKDMAGVEQLLKKIMVHIDLGNILFTTKAMTSSDIQINLDMDIDMDIS